MQARKTWFAGLCIFLYLCGSAYTLLSGISTLGTGSEYPYLYPALVILTISGTLFAVILIASISARLQLPSWAARHPLLMTGLEWGIAALILIATFVIRIVYIQHFPMEPSSDYKTYYEIAQLISRGTLLEDGEGYCEYISMFPHVYGYSYVLSIFLTIFGDSVWVGQMLNVVCAVLTCFLIWRCAVMLAGRASGLAALAITAFWPSQILYNNILAAEYVFSLMLFFCFWVFLHLVKVDVSSGKAQVGLLIGHPVLGILIGLTSAVRPMAMLLLISIVLYLFPCRTKLPILPENDLPVSSRAMSRGWIRAALILAGFLVTNTITSKCVSYAVDREITGGSTSFGYNLLVGLNQDSYGGWNQEDANYLYDALDESGSAQQAQAASRDLAMERLKVPIESLLNLFFHKYSVLWANDDYGSTWNILFMDQQGTLTEARSNFLYQMRDFNNYYYMIVVAFSALAAVLLIRRSGSWIYVPMTVFLGTVAMHLLVENQNRYHFHALYLFVLLAAYALHLLYQICDDFIVHGQADRTARCEAAAAEERAYRRIQDAEAYAQRQQEQEMNVRFDIGSALREGHVRVSVSQAVSDTPQPEIPHSETTPPAKKEAASPTPSEAVQETEEIPDTPTAAEPETVQEFAEIPETAAPAETVQEDSTAAVPEASLPAAEAAPRSSRRYDDFDLVGDLDDFDI